MTATSPYLNHTPRGWREVWLARLARELCPDCHGTGCRTIRAGGIEICEPCRKCATATPKEHQS